MEFIGMSYAFPSDKERQLYINKKKHLRSIMVYNQQQAAFKQRIKTEQQQAEHAKTLLEDSLIKEGMK